MKAIVHNECKSLKRMERRCYQKILDNTMFIENKPPNVILNLINYKMMVHTTSHGHDCKGWRTSMYFTTWASPSLIMFGIAHMDMIVRVGEPPCTLQLELLLHLLCLALLVYRRFLENLALECQIFNLFLKIVFGRCQFYKYFQRFFYSQCKKLKLKIS
jgi:hypothetical protein